MKNIEAGLGDVLLRYPELINGPAPQDEAFLKTLPDYFIAVHPFASTPNKAFPNPDVLFDWLRRDGVPFVVLGNEPLYLAPYAIRVPGRLPLSFEVLRRARKFVGTLSSFNCAAQLMMKPSHEVRQHQLPHDQTTRRPAHPHRAITGRHETGLCERDRYHRPGATRLRQGSCGAPRPGMRRCDGDAMTVTQTPSSVHDKAIAALNEQREHAVRPIPIEQRKVYIGRNGYIDARTPTTKRAAIKDGLDYFFTGRLCKRGHLALRHVANGRCIQCKSK